MPYFFVSWHTNFIITSGPMAITSSYWLPALTSASSAFVTRPFSPQLPSSDIFTTWAETASNSFSRITRSLLRKPTTLCTSAPSSCSFFAVGYAMAQPTPPPTTATFFSPSSLLGVPSGPTKSTRLSPAFRAFNSIVAPPTIWKMIVTVPALRS